MNIDCRGRYKRAEARYLIIVWLKLNNPIKNRQGGRLVCGHQIASLSHEVGNVWVWVPNEDRVDRLKCCWAEVVIFQAAQELRDSPLGISSVACTAPCWLTAE